MQLDIYNRLAYYIYSIMWTGMDFFPGLDREYFLMGEGRSAKILGGF